MVVSVSKFLSLFACGAKRDRLRRCRRNVEEVESNIHFGSVSKDYVLGDILGCEGTYGRVLEGVSIKNGKCFAVKMIMKYKGYKAMLRNEIDIMKKLNHPHVAKLECVYDDKRELCLVMEKYCGGDLFDAIIQSGGRFDEKHAMKIMHQLLQALDYVHSDLFVAHCDVKPSNIMLTADGDVKLIDFGASQSVHDGEQLHAEVGSPSYMAPEILLGTYNEQVDSWSAGVVLFVMIFGFNPFDPSADAPKNKIYSNVVKGFIPVAQAGYGSFFPSSVPASDQVKNLISSLLVGDYMNRFTASEALDHPWFK